MEGKNLTIGKPLFWGVTLFPVLILFISVPEYFTDFSVLNITYTLIPKLLGIVGISMFAANLIISNKSKFIDQAFGGMDKAYLFHKKVGKSVYLIIFAHFVAVHLRLLNISTAEVIRFATNLNDMPVNLGKIAFFGLTVIIGITLFYRKNYELVKKIHRFMPLVLITGAVHAMAMPTSFIAEILPLRLYLFTLINLGVVIFLVRLLGQRFGYFGEKYSVKSINVINKNVTEITMVPERANSQVIYSPGQFGFFRFKKEDGWVYNGEEHPFTFTSIPNENGELKVSAKSSGDFSSALKTLAEGDQVFVNGGFGSFQLDTSTEKEIVMVAGGIGITPFLSILRNLKSTKDDSYKINFFYSYRGDDDAIYLDELKELHNIGIIKELVLIDTEVNSRISVDQLLNDIRDINQTQFYMCGPKKMIDGLSDELGTRKVPKSNIHFELFSLFF